MNIEGGVAAFATQASGYTGGDFVNIIVARTLLGAYRVYYYPSSYKNMMLSLETFDQREIANSMNVASGTGLCIPTPYSELVGCKKALRMNPDLLVLNDDIPRGVVRKSKKILLYVHYPQSAKIKSADYVNLEYQTSFSGKAKWEFHKRVFPLFFDTGFKEVDERVTVIANSSVTFAALKKLCDRINPLLIYPPVDAYRVSTLSEHYIREPRAIYSGRVTPDKGVHELLFAVYYLKQRGLHLPLEIVGPMTDAKYLSSLKRLAFRLGVSHNVTFRGFVTRMDLIKLYSTSSVYVHPSRIEPFGISVVEAMAAGCVPVVKYGFNGPTRDILQNSGAYGYTYTSVDQLARHIEEALKWKGRNILRKRAFEFDISCFQAKIRKATFS